MNFNQFRARARIAATKAPSSKEKAEAIARSKYYGAFNFEIVNAARKYCFHHLLWSYSGNKDVCGFHQNHYDRRNLPFPKEKRSKFHDEEDVSVTIERKDFVSAEMQGEYNIKLTMATWTALISW